MDCKEEDVKIGWVHKISILHMQHYEMYSPDLRGSVACLCEDGHKRWGVVTGDCFVIQLNNL
jgi:hypothetical protein